MQSWRQQLPNLLSLARLLAAPALAWLAWRQHTAAFTWLLALAMLSDVLDGWLARRFGSVSGSGALLDSCADLALLSVVLYAIWPLHPEVYRDHAAPMLTVVGLVALGHACSLLRFGRLASFHTRLLRAGVLVFSIFALVLFAWGFQRWLLYSAIIICAAGALEQLVMVLVLPHWSPDLAGGIRAALALRRASGTRPAGDAPVESPEPAINSVDSSLEESRMSSEIPHQVVILVPGTMGSELKDPGRLWPGHLLGDWVFGDYDHLDRLMAPTVTPTDVWRTFFGIFRIYQSLIDDLEDCGFQENSSPPTLYTCPYDWRLALQNTTTELEKRVVQARSDHGEDVSIVLIGHSLGGLMCRYFLESGLYDATWGFDNVTQCILMGVPNLGLPLMLTLARGDLDYVCMDKSQIKAMLNEDELAFSYLMLPATSAEQVTHNTGGPPPPVYDLFAPAEAAKVGLSSMTNLSFASNFRNTLDAGARPDGVQYFSFVGNHHDTYGSAVVDTAAGGTPYDVDRYLHLDGGDGTVPLWSAWGAGSPGLHVGGKHDRIWKNAAVRSKLKELLGCAGDAEDSPDAYPAAELDIGDWVFKPGIPFAVGLRFHEEGARERVPQLRLDIAIISEEGHFRVFEASSAPLPRMLDIGDVRRASLVMHAPETPGVYRLSLELDGEAVSRAHFVVKGSGTGNCRESGHDEPEQGRSGSA